MNDFKKPHSLIAGANVILTIGCFMYMYRELEQLKNDNRALREDLNKLTGLVNKHSNEYIQIEDHVGTVEKTVRELRRDKRVVEDDVLSIKDALSESDLGLSFPKSRKKKTTKKYESSEESESAESPKRKPKKKKDVTDDVYELSKEFLARK
jgi:chromosome segregation ATPase